MIYHKSACPAQIGHRLAGGVNLEAGFSFFSRSRHRPRRFTALVAVFAVILPPHLFAWHHHELSFASRGAPVVVAAATGWAAPALADHDCPICSAVAHDGAVPVNYSRRCCRKARCRGRFRRERPPTPAPPISSSAPAHRLGPDLNSARLTRRRTAIAGACLEI